MTAKILLHGATGVTGGLVCESLARRAVDFAVAGRNREKVVALAKKLGVEGCVISIDDRDSIERAFTDRRVVISTAGPFAEVGEPIVAAAARMGVAYLDSTGEQAFVRTVFDHYGRTAEERRALLVPAFAFEIALGDFAASIATKRLGRTPDSIDILYDSRLGEGSQTTRGTRLSALGVIATDGFSYRDGERVPERVAAHRRTFDLDRLRRGGVSFHSPEAITVPRHTHARNVTAYLSVPDALGAALQVSGFVLPKIVRATRGFLEKQVARGPEGPDPATRESSAFAVVAEARTGREVARAIVRGRDPYGLTGEILAEGARRLSIVDRTERTLVGARAPSEVFDPEDFLRNFESVRID